MLKIAYEFSWIIAILAALYFSPWLADDDFQSMLPWVQTLPQVK